MISRLGATIFISVVITTNIAAYSISLQTKPRVRRSIATQTASLETEVIQLRSDLLSAIKRRDAARLARLYADDFTHTHAIGKVDNKRQRIAALISGEPTIESVAPDEMQVRIYAPSAAVVTGRSTLKDNNNEAVSYRWTTLYVKRTGNWQVVASHASRVVAE